MHVKYLNERRLKLKMLLVKRVSVVFCVVFVIWIAPVPDQPDDRNDSKAKEKYKTENEALCRIQYRRSNIGQWWLGSQLWALFEVSGSIWDREQCHSANFQDYWKSLMMIGGSVLALCQDPMIQTWSSSCVPTIRYVQSERIKQPWMEIHRVIFL